MDDPVILNVFPLVSFLSGGIPVTVTGSNLHVTQLSSLCVKMTSEAHTFCEICYASENGSTMICRSPNITRSDPVATDNRPLGAEYFFSMDGTRKVISSDSERLLRNTILYYVDPILSVFPGPRAVRQFYDDENYLEVQGKYLDLAASQSNYQVTIGGSECSVVQLTAAALICRPKKPESIDEAEMNRAVQVYVGNLVFTVGSLRYAKRHENLLVIATAVPIATAVCLLTVVVFAVLTCRFCAGQRKSSKDHVSFIEVQNSRVGTVMTDVQLDNRDLEPVFDAESWSNLLESNMLIENDSLKILDVIGQGHFGCVYRGMVQTEADKGWIEVAVKTVKASTEDAFTNRVLARKFVDEALRMRFFDHPHVLRVIGMSLGKDDIPLVILPFMKHGDLLSYLRNADNSPTVRDLMEFCIQIADGMDYLAGLKFVHRDLAARNCMLDDCMQVKVADFGLSRDIYERDYYSSDDRKACLPVKWMSPESLEKGIYNAKTDVWSYGVVLWELMTRGVTPYPEVDNWDVIKFLKSGRRLPQPTYCPDSLYQAMQSCWHRVAILRPSFASLKSALNEIINSMETETECSTQHNVTYVNVPNSLDYLVPNAEQRQLRLVVIK